MHSPKISKLFFLSLLIGLLYLAPAAVSAAGKCDRDCLIAVMDRYLEAVVSNAPTKAPLASGYRSTENAVEVKKGEGIWRTATALGKIQRRYADPVSRHAGYFGLVEEDGNPALVALRLKIEREKVSEAEWIIARRGTVLYKPEGVVTYPPPEESVNAEKRSSREEMIAAADSYFSGIQAHDGSGVLSHSGCYRIENGTWMCGLPANAPPAAPEKPEKSRRFGDGIKEPFFANSQCNSGFEQLAKITAAVINRRYFVADEQAGIVMGTVIFTRQPDAKGRDGKPMKWLYLTEVFVIEEGRIRGIFAAMDYLPPEIKTSGWPNEL